MGTIWKKHIIGNQDIDQLPVIMKSIYLQMELTMHRMQLNKLKD